MSTQPLHNPFGATDGDDPARLDLRGWIIAGTATAVLLVGAGAGGVAFAGEGMFSSGVLEALRGRVSSEPYTQSRFPAESGEPSHLVELPGSGGAGPIGNLSDLRELLGS